MGPPLVEVICVDDALFALALRGTLEYFACRVNLHLVATADQLASALAGLDGRARVIALCCHGDSGTIVLPELAPQVRAIQRIKDPFLPAHLQAHARFAGSIVLGLGCGLGRNGWPEAALVAGASAYIAPDGDSEGNAALVFAVQFCYRHLACGQPPAVAHAAASAAVVDPVPWRLHSAG